MNQNLRRLRRRQVDESLAPYRTIQRAVVPSQGWLKTVRQAIGMTTAQLAKRLHISQPSVVSLEQRESEGRVTMQSLRAAAQAMGCELHYVLLPPSSLDDIVTQQIRTLITQRMAHVTHTMALEAQEVSASHTNDQVEEMMRETLANTPKHLWE